MNKLVIKTLQKEEKVIDPEVYSYLNIRDRTLGKWYKLTGVNPLGEDFVLNKKAVEEALLLGQMKDKRFTVPFGNESKSFIKKKAKLSRDNCNKLWVYVRQEHPFSKKFNQKFESYLTMRMYLTTKLFDVSRNQEFDEIGALRQVHNLDVVFAELLEFGDEENSGLYGQKLQPLVEIDLETKYAELFAKKLEKVQENADKKVASTAQKQPTADLEKSKVAASKIEKEVQETKKRNNKKSVEKVRQEIKTANAENKAKKVKEKK